MEYTHPLAPAGIQRHEVGAVVWPHPIIAAWTPHWEGSPLGSVHKSANGFGSATGSGAASLLRADFWGGGLYDRSLSLCCITSPPQA